MVTQELRNTPSLSPRSVALSTSVLSQPGHVMFCSRSQVKHLMARLPATSCCTTNTTSHNRILHNLGHCSLSIFHFVSLLSIPVSPISSFSVCSHCHKKILKTESS